jgi:hypothetical protein
MQVDRQTSAGSASSGSRFAVFGVRIAAHGVRFAACGVRLDVFVVDLARLNPRRRTPYLPS